MKTQLNNKSKGTYLKVSYFQVLTEIYYENQGTIDYPFLVPVHKEEEHVLVKSVDIFIDKNSRIDRVEKAIIDETSDRRVHYFSFDSTSSDFVDALKKRPFIRAILQ